MPWNQTKSLAHDVLHAEKIQQCMTVTAVTTTKDTNMISLISDKYIYYNWHSDVSSSQPHTNEFPYIGVTQRPSSPPR